MVAVHTPNAERSFNPTPIVTPTARAKILLVEDEENLQLTLSERLRREGYEVRTADTCRAGESWLSTERFDIAVLDVGLPDGDGFTLAEVLARKQPTCAVIFLSAQSDPTSRVRGLEIGAEDYIAKPFHTPEFLLRVKNALKRKFYREEIAGEKEIVLGRARIDLKQVCIIADEQRHILSPKEIAILKFLLERRGKVVSRDEILNFVWGYESFPTPRTIDNFILRLRRWVERDPADPQVIRSIRGVGYQLV